MEGAPIAEEWTPEFVADADLDTKLGHGVVIPFADLGDAGKNQWKTKSDRPFVKALRAGAQAETTAIIDRQVDIDGEVLVRAEVIDDEAAAFAVDHVGIEATRNGTSESAEPGDSLSAVIVEIGVIFDGEGNIAALLGEHDVAPATEVKKRHGVERAVPDGFHDAGADTGEVINAGEAESLLNFWMKKFEFLAKGVLVDGWHQRSSLGLRTQFAAEGMKRRLSRATAARTMTARLRVSGLKA